MHLMFLLLGAKEIKNSWQRLTIEDAMKIDADRINPAKNQTNLWVAGPFK